MRERTIIFQQTHDQARSFMDIVSQVPPYHLEDAKNATPSYQKEAIFYADLVLLNLPQLFHATLFFRYQVCALKWHPDRYNDSTKVTNTIMWSLPSFCFWNWLQVGMKNDPRKNRCYALWHIDSYVRLPWANRIGLTIISSSEWDSVIKLANTIFNQTLFIFSL